MRCDFCQGQGFVFKGVGRTYDETATGEKINIEKASFHEPCRECGGNGILSCCEGGENFGPCDQ